MIEWLDAHTPSTRQLLVFSLVFQLVSLLVWATMTAIVESQPKLQHSIAYLTFVSNWALVASSLGGAVAAIAALRSEKR